MEKNCRRICKFTWLRFRGREEVLEEVFGSFRQQIGRVFVVLLAEAAGKDG
jgi:hypothetical protein